MKLVIVILMLQSRQTFQSLVTRQYRDPYQILNNSMMMNQLILLFATPSCTVIERKPTYTCFKNTNETFRLFLVGAISFQTVKCIGRLPSPLPPPSITFLQVMSDLIPGETFERILQNLHHCHNEQLDK